MKLKIEIALTFALVLGGVIGVILGAYNNDYWIGAAFGTLLGVGINMFINFMRYVEEVGNAKKR